MPPGEPAGSAAVAGRSPRAGSGGAAPRGARDAALRARAEPGSGRRDAGDLRALREHVLGDRAAVQPRLRGDAAARTPASISGCRARARRSTCRRRSILPEAPRTGIVVNVPAMRLYYFTTEKPSEAGGARSRQGLESSDRHRRAKAGRRRSAKPRSRRRSRTRSGTCRRRFARSTPSAAIRCRASCTPGPDNPLGAYAMTLSLPSYLIHGTNKPAGVGMRSSHGCIRLYPEDIEALFARVARGTAVRLVNQPVLAGWRDGQLYLEVHPPLAEEAARSRRRSRGRAESRAGARRPGAAAVSIDRAAIEKIVDGAARHSVAGAARRSLARAVSGERAHRREHGARRARRGDGAARGAARGCRPLSSRSRPARDARRPHDSDPRRQSGSRPARRHDLS